MLSILKYSREWAKSKIFEISKNFEIGIWLDFGEVIQEFESNYSDMQIFA